MSNKLEDRDLALIMSYVDGELEPSKKAHVEKLISENSDAKVAYEDLKLSSNVYGDYVSSIKENSGKIIAKNKHLLEKEKKSFFNTIFQNPMRNFVTYPIAAIFIFTLGFQMNSISIKKIEQENAQFRGLEKQESRIKDLEQQVTELKEQINNYIKEIEKLSKLLKEKN